jgi:hypothetical protein
VPPRPSERHGSELEEAVEGADHHGWAHAKQKPASKAASLSSYPPVSTMYAQLHIFTHKSKYRLTSMVCIGCFL